jgi:hypothetical protein
LAKRDPAVELGPPVVAGLVRIAIALLFECGHHLLEGDVVQVRGGLDLGDVAQHHAVLIVVQAELLGGDVNRSVLEIAQRHQTFLLRRRGLLVFRAMRSSL